MILTIAVFALYCSCCSAKRLSDDKTNWELIWKEMKREGMSRSDYSKLSVFDAILRINAKERGSGSERSDSNIFLFQGDIKMNKREVEKLVDQGSQGTSRQKRAVMRKTGSNLWQRNIAYSLDRGLNSRARSVIRSAIREWQQTLPCMGTWYDVTNRGKPRSYMHFFQGGGCYSQVGRVGGRQRVSIGRGCEHHGIAVHEIGHAMGLWHEQSRPDRDSYVRILWNNIIPATKFNFQKHSTARVDSLGVPYDYDSVMHYGATAFARARGLVTIQRKQGGKILGQRRGLSRSDKKQVQLLYGCTGPKPTPRPTQRPRPTKPTVCKDTPSHRNWCTESQKLGLCRNSLFKSYMTSHCCSKCKTGCMDINESCDSWGKYGYCKHGHKYKSFMEKNCCKTCRSVVKNCVNKDKRCLQWKRYCTDRRYDNFMKKNCRKTCFC